MTGQSKRSHPGPAPIYSRTPTDYHGDGIFSIFLFPSQIKSTTAHTKSITPLIRVARFGTESNTETVAGSNRHPNWRAATQLDHCAAAPPALAVLPPCGICMAKKWRFWLLEHRGWGTNTHLWDWWAHETPGAWGLSLPFVIHGCTRGSTVHNLLPQNRVTDYHTLTLHVIWFSDSQVSSCAFFLNWNQSACFFPYSVTHFSIGKRFFFC